MNKPELGKIQKVDLRTVWSSESGDFTPWLASPENISLLGKTVDLGLEVETTEKDVGPFRADILCKDSDTGAWVLIENQLEPTNHTHLGQLLTYAAGLKAATIIWIARQFTNEHRAVLDWLNEITDEGFAFFGIEIELWKIGDSIPAVNFKLVSKPNDWSKSVKTAAGGGELNEFKRTRLEFWTAFKKYMEDGHSKVRCRKPAASRRMVHPIGLAGCRLWSTSSHWDAETGRFNGGELRVELVLNGHNSEDYFKQLQAQRHEIEEELGETLAWHNRPNVRMRRIYVVRGSADPSDRSKWPEFYAWLRQKLEAFDRVFRPRVQNLSTPEIATDGPAGEVPES